MNFSNNFSITHPQPPALELALQFSEPLSSEVVFPSCYHKSCGNGFKYGNKESGVCVCV